ncbi:hypothetical protein D3Z48_18000 [Clostridiaceae bacterium]|nr:hypothetical protein [Clostridiaceae bacterium]
MIHVVSFVYCDAVEQPGNITKLVTPLQFLNPISFPTQYSFSVSFGLFDLTEYTELPLRYDFLNAQGNVVYSSGDITINLLEFKNNMSHLGLQLNFEIKNAFLEAPGEYKSVLYIQNKEHGTFPIIAVSKETGDLNG